MNHDGSGSQFSVVTKIVSDVIVITQIVNKNACVRRVLRKLGPGVTYVTNATSEQIKVGTALACAYELSVLPNLCLHESEPTSPASLASVHT